MHQTNLVLFFADPTRDIICDIMQCLSLLLTTMLAREDNLFATPTQRYQIIKWIVLGITLLYNIIILAIALSFPRTYLIPSQQMSVSEESNENKKTEKERILTDASVEVAEVYQNTANHIIGT